MCVCVGGGAVFPCRHGLHNLVGYYQMTSIHSIIDVQRGVHRLQYSSLYCFHQSAVYCVHVAQIPSRFYISCIALVLWYTNCSPSTDHLFRMKQQQNHTQITYNKYKMYYYYYSIGAS